ncbi:MAG: AmmeMemoRadiSam system radical SAM enzyme [Anaerolineae bacterium]|nr:AmmeMemoRadiSam system radical SAM enzyme [Anaerolineae bacterium]
MYLCTGKCTTIRHIRLAVESTILSSNVMRIAKMTTLQDRLDEMTVAGELYEVVDPAEKKIRCFACGHRCLIRDGGRGVCKVRYNEGGVLRVPHGYVGALQVDPIEKKPFNHITPSATVISFGMLGCDLHCSYCQNWEISQHGRDKQAGRDPYVTSAAELVKIGKSRGATAIASTYNEPLITSEWAVTIFKEAHRQGMKALYISNGNGTPEVIRYLRPHLDGYKIDLKAMNDKTYRQLGGVLQNVLDTIRLVKESGLWLEIVTLIVPGLNDSPDELWDAARFIRSVSPDIPWHVTAFHPDYRMTDPPSTTEKMLVNAAEIGAEAGLHYVYAGNAPGRVGDWEHTRCPSCQRIVVRRFGFRVIENQLSATAGHCPGCQTLIHGVW